jgi:hypothetical protein
MGLQFSAGNMRLQFSAGNMRLQFSAGNMRLHISAGNTAGRAYIASGPNLFRMGACTRTIAASILPHSL